MRTIDFDAAKHEYRVDGVVWPSVTEILKAEGFVDDRWFNEECAAFGTAVHDALAAFDLGFPVEPVREVGLYFDAWWAFIKENKVEIHEVEHRVLNLDLRYCGTIDRIVTMKGGKWVLDIKTGSKVPATALQTAGYERCLPKAAKRCAVYLKDNGRYALDEHDDRDDARIFQNAAVNYHWKREHGITA